MTVAQRMLRGAAAGAVGTTALNAVTYLDMAVRGRPASDTPQRAVETLAAKIGHRVAGNGEQKANRLAGLGPLSGIATGVLIGVGVGLARPIVARLPPPVAAAVIGSVAMLLTDAPLTSLGLTDPTKWSGAEWAADLIPHLAYGAITYAALRATQD
jgi:hypothetical protein